jgi:predicted ATP-binding protein involved in virulence
MRLERIQLVDFRGFANLEVHFERDVTVIVGVNGAGKSSLLDAIAVMLSDALYRAAGERPRGFEDLDVRVGAQSTWVEVSVSLAGKPQPITWSLAHSRKGFKRGRAVHRGAMMSWTEEIVAQRAAGAHFAEPLAVYYPTERTVLDVPGKIGKKHSFTPVEALALALQGRTVDFRLFFEWFREREDVENERRARESTAHRDPALEAVRRAIVAFMPGVTDPRVQRSPQRFVVTKDGITLEVDQLSDGERSLLALVGDLARRLAMAADGDPLAHEAVVIIDEVELHLHPGLQRDVIHHLRRTFPQVQFVLTTHSPFALGEVESRSIRLLSEFAVAEPTIETSGQDIGAISQRVQGAPQRPRDVDAMLIAAHAALDRSSLAEAEDQVGRLRERLGPHDPDVIRLESLLDLFARG